MNKRKRHSFGKRFTKAEIALWAGSVGLIAVCFLAFDRKSLLLPVASWVGVTSLLLNAKGKPLGQALMLLFCVLYGVISYQCAYYGEMLTYLGMSAPMAACSLFSWLKHPCAGNRSEVQVNRLCRWEWMALPLLTVGVTGLFYPLLAFFHTANLLPSTISVATSFLAAYLTFRRSAFFAAAYAANDGILILLWSLVSGSDPSYQSVVVCFSIFLVHDLYGLGCWLAMRRRQERGNGE